MNIRKSRIIAGIAFVAVCAGQVLSADAPSKPAAPPAPAAPVVASPPATPTRYDPEPQEGNDRVIIHQDLSIAQGEMVPHDAVVIMGDLTCDGTIDHDAVVVLGNITLGPHAHVAHDVVCVGGHLNKDPSATIGHEPVVVNPFGYLPRSASLSAWWNKGLSHGNVLPFGRQMCWVWVLNASLLAFYALLSAVFPAGMRKCGDALVARPLAVLSSGSLVILGLPILFLLLLITIVGIPVALIFLPLGIVVGVLFGRAAIYNLVGRSLGGQALHPALATLLGGLVFICLYIIPVLGLFLSILVAVVGFACVGASLFAALTGPGAPPAVPAAPAPVPPVMAPPVLETPPLTLPKAGFWIRMCALLLDFILVAIVLHGLPGLIFPGIALYAAAMWHFRGTTVAGMIFHLRVVRVDGRAVDWGTALARAFACFFSAIVAGLGFVWIGIDSEKQGWHDKIAGTVVVRTPRSTPLV